MEYKGSRVRVLLGTRTSDKVNKFFYYLALNVWLWSLIGVIILGRGGGYQWPQKGIKCLSETKKKRMHGLHNA